MPNSTPNLDTLFCEAVSIPDASSRAAFLKEACGSDTELGRRVEALVAAHFRAGNFLEEPLWALETEAGDPSPDAGLAAFTVSDVGATIGPYKLRELLGEGGMGSVYVAEQIQPVRRKVALKVIKLGMDSREIISRFESERQALALMDHPNIAMVLDAGTTENGRPYFVMELVKGLPITAHCDAHKLGTRERLELFLQVCQAVQHAHQKAIIHRDLKPSNIIVAMHDTKPVVKVIDFGVAKAIGQQLTDQTLYTGFSHLVGTPLYMSPEQAGLSSLDIDTRSDVYSLGVLLYEMLTGQTPFESKRLREAGYDEMRRIIREEEPPRPSVRVTTLRAACTPECPHCHGQPRDLVRTLRGELDWIVMKCLDKDRNRRYPTARGLAADVQRYLDNEPVEACPPSTVYRVRKFMQRRKTLVFSSALAVGVPLLTLLASTILTAGAYQREKTEHGLADQQRKSAERQEALAQKQKALAEEQKQEAERQRDAARQNLYVADTRLAFVDIGLGNADRARESLLAHFPDRGDDDRRGWEWYHLLGRSHEADEALYGHRADVQCIAFSPDGKYIASTSIDGSARVWDAKSAKQLRCFDQGPTIKCGLGWSPDGMKLAWGSASDEAALRIWNRDTDQIAAVHGCGGSIWAVAWSHDGKHVATGSLPSERDNVRIWDADKLESIAQFTTTDNVYSVSWSSDDRLLAVAARGGGCIIWELASQQQLGDTVMEGATCAAWHVTERQLAAGDKLGNCVIWDYPSRKTIRQWNAHRGQLTDLKWNHDGTCLLSSGADGVLKLWDIKEGREQRSVAAHAGWARSADWDPTGGRFASSGTDGVIRVWPIERRPSPLVIDTKLRGNLDLTWDNESAGLLLASGDAGKIGIWEARTGKMLDEIPLAQSSDRRLVSFRRVLERLASPADAPAVVRISDVPAHGALAKAVCPAASNTGWFWGDAVLSPERTRIAYMDPSGRPLIRDLDSDHVVECPGVLHPAGAAWSPDGRLLAVVGRGATSDDGTLGHAGWVHVFDADTGSRLRKLRIGTRRMEGTAVAWSHDGRKLAAGNDEGLCEIWEAESGRKLVSARIHASRVHDLAWSLDDRRLASGGISEQVHVWDSFTGQELLALEPHGSPIRRIRWSPDGRKLAAVNDDGVIRVWDATEGYDLTQCAFWPHLIEPIQWREYSRLIDNQHWSEAAVLLRKITATGGSDCRAMYQLAHVNLQLDDQAAYRETCERMLSTFAGTEDKHESRSTAWVCALRPGALEDYSLAITLARRALDGQTDSRTKRESGRADYPETLGAVLFRAGQYEKALRHLQAAREKDANYRPWPARIAYLLAMTHLALGHRADAETWLERADKEANEELNGHAAPDEWSERLDARWFHREARERILAPNQDRTAAPHGRGTQASGVTSPVNQP